MCADALDRGRPKALCLLQCTYTTGKDSDLCHELGASSPLSPFPVGVCEGSVFSLSPTVLLSLATMRRVAPRAQFCTSLDASHPPVKTGRGSHPAYLWARLLDNARARMIHVDCRDYSSFLDTLALHYEREKKRSARGTERKGKRKKEKKSVAGTRSGEGICSSRKRLRLWDRVAGLWRRAEETTDE
ncbi:uncharacterized protein LY79DRAFT_342755 [Colletotrichum navitas]|uniref:Uncharacterized protein n=1 Tax=Colletotrichum navitas TaxID=681940 RepID=A0AAD8PRL9_9PEZI|nr:uncharacterized protein LY79DRAFT_342755 [Colletotrichum navitas]KAK1579453.1 hypothetical protein LY79DRAFT_342755 [Colletotrichum navitas]